MKSHGVKIVSKDGTAQTFYDGEEFTLVLPVDLTDESNRVFGRIDPQLKFKNVRGEIHLVSAVDVVSATIPREKPFPHAVAA